MLGFVSKLPTTRKFSSGLIISRSQLILTTNLFTNYNNTLIYYQRNNKNVLFHSNYQQQSLAKSNIFDSNELFFYSNFHQKTNSNLSLKNEYCFQQLKFSTTPKDQQNSSQELEKR